jgi:hypothetical protein
MKSGLKSGGGDMRIRYTRKVLKESLLGLMKERQVTTIGIKEICAAAGVSRSTFYTYYNDVYHLLGEIEDEAMSALDNIINQYISRAKNNKKEMAAMLQRILQGVADNGNSFQILLSENGDFLFQKKFFEKYIVWGRKILQENSETSEDAHIHEGYSVFIVHGAIGLVQYWLKNNMHIPIPKLTKMLTKLAVVL